MSDSCPVCLKQPATVVIKAVEEVRACSECSRILEQLARLAGYRAQRFRDGVRVLR